MSLQSLGVNYFEKNPGFCFLFLLRRNHYLYSGKPVMALDCKFSDFFPFYFLALYVVNILLVWTEINVVLLDTQCHDLGIKPHKGRNCYSYPPEQREWVGPLQIWPGKWMFRGVEAMRSSRGLLSRKHCLCKVIISPRNLEWKLLPCPDN